MYNKIVYALVLVMSLSVAMFILTAGSQPERTASHQLTLDLFSGSMVETQGKGTVILSSCSFFEVQNKDKTPTYGVNLFDSGNCGDTPATAATMSLQQDDVLIVIEGGGLIKATFEASDGYILVAEYPSSLTWVMLVFVSLAMASLCLIAGIVVFGKR